MSEFAQISFLSLLALALAVLAVPQTVQAQCYNELSPADAATMMAEDSDLVLVDVRELSEYCVVSPTPPLPPGHIPGALNLPFSSGVLEQRYEELPSDQVVIIICRSGGRGRLASEFLCDQGFETVYNVTGGMLAWTGETTLCNDSDEDGVFDDVDVCPTVADPDQTDSDGDGIGDACEQLFRRGDANLDKTVDIANAVFTLSFLFGGEAAPACRDAADANDDGVIDIGDPITVLGHLFGGGGALPQPSGDCGVDITADLLECEILGPCGQGD